MGFPCKFAWRQISRAHPGMVASFSMLTSAMASGRPTSRYLKDLSRTVLSWMKWQANPFNPTRNQRIRAGKQSRSIRVLSPFVSPMLSVQTRTSLPFLYLCRRITAPCVCDDGSGYIRITAAPNQSGSLIALQPTLVQAARSAAVMWAECFDDPTAEATFVSTWCVRQCSPGSIATISCPKTAKVGCVEQSCAEQTSLFYADARLSVVCVAGSFNATADGSWPGRNRSGRFSTHLS